MCVCAIKQVPYSTLQSEDSTLARRGNHRLHRGHYVGIRKLQFRTYLQITHNATCRRPTVTQMFLAHSGSSFLHALAGSSTPRFQLHLLFRTARRRNERTIHSTSLPTPPPLSSLETSKDAAAARDWLMRFRACPIPRAAVDITFSRSSGPGGQVCATRLCVRSHRTGDSLERTERQ